MPILMYIPGHWEIIVIVLAILVLFGGKKIPEMMRGIGSGVKEFRKGIREDEDEKEKKEVTEDQEDKK